MKLLLKMVNLQEQTVKINEVNWTLKTNLDEPYIGFDKSQYAKGVQIGSKSAPATEVSMSTEDYKDVVKKITVYAAGASGIENTTITIKINGVEVGSGTIAMEKTEFTFTCEASGKIEILINGANKAVYIASIAINK